MNKPPGSRMNKPSGEQPIVPPRNPTRRIRVGRLEVGDGAPISVQSMVKAPVSNVEAARSQICSAAAAGAELMRVAVPDESAVTGLGRLVRESPVELVADVHFRADLALASIDAGVAGVRVNPQTIGSAADLERIGRAAAERSVAVRVGVNAARLAPHQHPRAERMVELALEALTRLAACGVINLKVSVKASDLATTLSANRLLAERCDYPIHLGLTEAGPMPAGLTKSTVALALLLCEGIGDTLRVSLSHEPVIEVRAGRALLRSLGLLRQGVDLVACPGCGRAHQDVAHAARMVEEALDGIRAPLTVAVMGCEVNGPGEASRADVGIAGTASGWAFFRQGAVSERLDGEEGPRRLIRETLKLNNKEDD